MDKQTVYSIVKASGVSPGELVLVHFWGDDRDKQIANEFVCAVAACGGMPILLQQSRIINQLLFAGAGDSCFDDKYFDLFSGVDAVLDIFAYQPIVLGGKIGEKGLNRYRGYITRLFDCLMKCSRFAQIRIPTAANAEESGLEPGDYIRRMTEAYSVDYDALRTACEVQAERLKELNRVTLHTGKGCKLQFDLTGRTWNIDAGDGDWPCGEVYIAPVEENTNGEVFFERLFIEDAGCFEDVLLRVEHGRLISASHEGAERFLQKLPPEGRVVCELGFGMNPNVKDLCGYTVLDEKMAGTFHIALGANHMFGGKNQAPVHIDLVGKGTVTGM